jgi:hypothetical protein
MVLAPLVFFAVAKVLPERHEVATPWTYR